MIPVQSDKFVFFDNSGDPLNGYIYIGQVNSDPRTAPKTVTFQDSGGSQFTAKQPLRTLSGKIVYNGKPITALVNGGYSFLILDNSMNQLDYVPSYDPDGGAGGTTADFSELLRVGLNLDEIKGFDVSPGETVRSDGKIAAQDGLGADWLVVSATGNTADDVDLIDFTNGLQGQRIANVAYSKDVIQTGTFIFDAPSQVVNTNDATSYRQTWTTINISGVVPNEASSAIVKIYAQAKYPSNTIGDSISVLGYTRKNGSSAPTSESNRIGAAYNRTNANDVVDVAFASQVTVPLIAGSASLFDFYLTVNDPSAISNNTSPDLNISVIGYTINQQDIL